MINERLTARDRGLIKGAIRRVFSRSELRRSVLEATKVAYVDVSRPRVKKWSVCPLCEQFTPTYKMQVDHIDPIIPLHSTLEEMTWDEVINRMWCDRINLRATCVLCHTIKTTIERKERLRIKKEKQKDGKSKA